MRHAPSFLAAALSVVAAVACEKLPAAPEQPNVPPTAAFFFTPVSPIYAGRSAVQFSAVGSADSDGQIVSYAWDFGDGTPPETTDGPVARHTFPSTGARCVDITYGVSLVVSDDKGAHAVAAQDVTVTQSPAPTAPECQSR